MRLFLFATLFLSISASAERPLVGDSTHGEKLLIGKSARVDGNWLNKYSEKKAIKGLRTGKAGFPKIKSRNILDQYDALAYLQAHNTSLHELFADASHTLVTTGKLDEYAKKRLVDAKVKLSKKDGKRRVFVMYDLGKAGQEIRRVRPKQHKMRDKLKPSKKIGYAVFIPVKLRGVPHEIAFGVDTDVVIRSIVVRGIDGAVPADLNRAAQRFIGHGARGKYEPLRAGGAGKAVRELQKVLSPAYLKGMESIYMYEVGEREQFLFDEE